MGYNDPIGPTLGRFSFAIDPVWMVTFGFAMNGNFFDGSNKSVICFR